MQLVYSKCSPLKIDLKYLVEYGPPLMWCFFFIFPPGILAGGIPLSFPLLAAFGVPLNIAVPSSQPIEVTCNGTEESIQQCQIVRLLQPSAVRLLQPSAISLLQPSAGTIAGVNCTGVYIYTVNIHRLQNWGRHLAPQHNRRGYYPQWREHRCH